jgi:cytokinin dehydrogenase
MDRRQFLSSVVAGGALVGFDPSARRWVADGEPAAESAAEPLPDLDGVVVRDDAALTADSTDQGNIVRRRPWAVLRPGSVDDIARMVDYCRRNDIQVAARGAGHTVYGQSLVQAGLVVEMRSLAAIHRIDADVADVDAGVHWKDLFLTATARGLTPPVLTGYTAMTVGGTLSVGGVGYDVRKGAQVDYVRELQVVTGEGRVVWCSPTVESDLFEGLLAGLGQLGIITRVVLDLEPAPAKVRQWTLVYTDPRKMLADMRTVLDRGEIEYVYGQVAMPVLAVVSDPSPLVLPLSELLPVIESLTSPLAQGLGSLVNVPALPLGTPWAYMLNVCATYRPGEPPPDGGHLLRGLSDNVLLRQRMDRPFTDFILRVDALVDFLMASGLWNGAPRPWIDCFLPGQEVDDFVVETFEELKFDDVGLAGFGLLFALRRGRLTRPQLRVPDTETDWVFLFDVLTSAAIPGPNAEFVAEKLARNRRIYERARSVGGTVYPISAVPMEPADWAGQYGPRYAAFAALKATHDPDGILAPGVDLF